MTARKNTSISSPLSFVGSAKRIWRLTSLTDNPFGRTALGVLASVLTLGAWTFIAVWYVVWIGLFGVFFFVFRLWRRSSRSHKALENAVKVKE